MLMVEYKLSIYGLLLTAMTYIDRAFTAKRNELGMVWERLGMTWFERGLQSV